jgi:hypothetical protein
MYSFRHESPLPRLRTTLAGCEQSWGTVMQIGEPQRVIVVEPLELPVGSPEREPEREPEPTIHESEPEKVPVAP